MQSISITIRVRVQLNKSKKGWYEIQKADNTSLVRSTCKKYIVRKNHLSEELKSIT